ncbi:GTP-binding protein [Amycolatopsis sp. GA6-003]|uniref:GTP-binding protein n=1 Tax=Amycolatopsis sp. GA6-003 TaxID=2652444 RepID=UPI0039174A5F
MNDDIIEQLIRAGYRPVPRRPEHLRVSAARLRARLASKSSGQLAQLVESARKAHDDIGDSSAAAKISALPDQPGPTAPHRGLGQSTIRPALKLVARRSPEPHSAGKPPVHAKIVVAGGAGAGKSTFVTSISSAVTHTAAAPSDGTGNPEWRPAILGELALAADLSLYLCSMPDPFQHPAEYDNLAVNALGGIVLADTARLADAFAHIDYLENRRIPYVVAVNDRDGIGRHKIKDVRRALVVDQNVPVKRCDARSAESVKSVLVALVDEAVRLHCSPGQSLPEELRLVADRILA